MSTPPTPLSSWARGVAPSPTLAVDAKAKALEAESLGTRLGTCLAKTQQSLSHDPQLKGRPRGWTLPINDILVYKGAGFVVPVAGEIKLMPGTGSDPAFRRVDVDVKKGTVTGLF